MPRRLAVEGGGAGGVDRGALPEVGHLREHAGAGRRSRQQQRGGEREVRQKTATPRPLSGRPRGLSQAKDRPDGPAQ